MRVLGATSTAVLVAVATVLGPTSLAGAAEPVTDAADGCVPTDTQGPVVHEVQLGATAIDVSSGPVTVPVRARVTDGGASGAATGVRTVAVFIGTRDLAAARFSRGKEHGTVDLLPAGDDWWVGELVVGQWDGYSSPWSVRGVRAWDGAGNSGQSPFDDALTAPSFTIAAHPRDLERPFLADMTLDRRVVNVRRHAGRLGVRLHVTDSGGAGVTAVAVQGAPLVLASGTASEGWWTGSVPVPRWSARGSRPLRVVLRDAAYNNTFSRPEWLRDRGLPWRYLVRSVPDRTAPAASAARLSDARVDVRTADGRVGVSVRVTDAQSGVVRVRADLRRPGISGLPRAWLTLKSGDRHDGRWRGRLLLPRCGTVAGSYTLLVRVTDRIGNRNVLRPSPRLQVVAPSNT